MTHPAVCRLDGGGKFSPSERILNCHQAVYHPPRPPTSFKFKSCDRPYRSSQRTWNSQLFGNASAKPKRSFTPRLSEINASETSQEAQVSPPPPPPSTPPTLGRSGGVKSASDWMSLFNYGGVGGGSRAGYSAADRYGDGSSRDYSSGKVIQFSVRLIKTHNQTRGRLCVARLRGNYNMSVGCDIH